MGILDPLALGGAFSAMAILTQNRIATRCNWWHFVMEALSVIIRVISFKTRGVIAYLKWAQFTIILELSGWSGNLLIASGLWCII